MHEDGDAHAHAHVNEAVFAPGRCTLIDSLLVLVMSAHASSAPTLARGLRQD